MDLIIVGGPHSGVGKTLASERALRALSDRRRFGAIKLTVADGEFDNTHDHGPSARAVADAAGICGRGASCGVCESVSARVPSRTIVHSGAIMKHGTDTWRLSCAGAFAVEWIIALRSAAPDAIHASIGRLAERGADAVLIEGTTALEWLQPDVAVMVATDPGRKWKSVALSQLASCAIVLRNHLPVSSGDLPAPDILASSKPIDCDLGSADDAGTRLYTRRLRDLFDTPPSPSTHIAAGTRRESG